ncbi:glycosyltransferase family 4 protein [Salinarimonas sp.]|uniref:glycosyltransferase family 4 protein n=1 Tax=Salinarimonas sp. TaxID=2766526 RepID=UPI0032D94A8F
MRHRVREGGLLVARNSEWLLACLRPRSRFVFETHDPPRGLRDRLITDRVLEHPGLKALVVISRPLRDAWAAARPQIASRILVAPDGADAVADPDGSAAQPRDATAPFRVGYVGHLYPGRGGELLVDVARTVPEAEFHLVGGRPEDVARLRGLAPPPNVIFHGHRPPSEVPTLMRRFDAVVAPYQAKVAVSGGGGDTVAWMSPLKIFEYMSHAKPIVVSDLPVLHEALERDRTALFVPASDVSAWADALRRLMRDPDERQALGRRAHETFLARYTWSRRAARILEAAGATS